MVAILEHIEMEQDQVSGRKRPLQNMSNVEVVTSTRTYNQTDVSPQYQAPSQATVFESVFYSFHTLHSYDIPTDSYTLRRPLYQRYVWFVIMLTDIKSFS